MFVLGFLVRRLLQGAVIALLVSFVIFTILRVIPGDPVRLMAGFMAPEELIEDIATKMGLRDPILVQYARYMTGVVSGDLGQSFVRPASGASVGAAQYDDITRSERASVLQLIADAAPYSIQLALLSMVFALLVAVPIGIYGGMRPGRWPDRVALYLSSLFVSLPNFWLGIVLALIVSVQLGWLPAIGYHGFAYTILPAIVLAVEIVPFIIRTLTVSVAQIMQQSYIEAALVRGLGRTRIVMAHAVRNASVPLLNMLGVQFSMLLGGVLVVEFVFDYPGLGLLTVHAVLQRDFPLIQGIAIVTSVAYVFINIVVDLVATTIDPRLDY